MQGILAATTEPTAVRTRTRPQPITLTVEQRKAIALDIMERFEELDQARSVERDMRRDRYQKLMQMGGTSAQPYDGASDVQLPDMMSACLRTEDTLVNAAMSTRPMVNSKAVSDLDKSRERKNDLLLDHQYFNELDGEDLTERSAVNFVRDGQFTAYTKWVKAHSKVMHTQDWSPIPPTAEPKVHFKTILAKVFSPGAWAEIPDSDGWDWLVTRNVTEEILVRFYTKDDGKIVMQYESDPESFCGPVTILYDWEDVLAPYWSMNLQPPGPANPHGAPHAIFRDFPTKEEILTLIEKGEYDLVTADDLTSMDDVGDWTNSDRELSRQRGILRGNDPVDGENLPDNQKQLMRLVCFDTWEGLEVQWIIIVDDKPHLARARPLTEVSPGIPPKRPISHTVMIPVQGTWVGMGLPELMESMHDFQVENFNIMVDASNYEIYPISKYRQSSSLKPETFEVGLAPGTAIPMQNPATDLVWDRLAPQSGMVCANMISMGQSYNETLTSIGDLQMGRIPTGKSAALRTAGGVQQVLAQGEARPERILRRFFKGIREIHGHMHRLNKHFLPEEKKFRVLDITQPDEDPFVSISRHEDLKDFEFSFHASVLNSSKVMQQQALEAAMGMLITPLDLQFGTSTPDTIYRLKSDWLKAQGLRPEHYLQKPSPTASNPPIFASEALSAIMHDQVPAGPPAEGDFDTHLAGFQAALGLVDEAGVKLVDTLSDQQKQKVALYAQQVMAQKFAAEQQAAAMAAAQQFQDQQGNRQLGGAPGGGGKKPETPMVNKNEVQDETLPSSGTPQ
jgi:hypothetical protein